MRALRQFCPGIIHKIRLESHIDDSTMEMEVPGENTIGDLKEIYCQGRPETPDQIILWFCGDDLGDDEILEEEFGHRNHLWTTFHVDRRSS